MRTSADLITVVLYLRSGLQPGLDFDAQEDQSGGPVLSVLASSPRDGRVDALKTRLAKLKGKVDYINHRDRTEAELQAVAW